MKKKMTKKNNSWSEIRRAVVTREESSRLLKRIDELLASGKIQSREVDLIKFHRICRKRRVSNFSFALNNF